MNKVNAISGPKSLIFCRATAQQFMFQMISTIQDISVHGICRDEAGLVNPSRGSRAKAHKREGGTRFYGHVLEPENPHDFRLSRCQFPNQDFGCSGILLLISGKQTAAAWTSATVDCGWADGDIGSCNGGSWEKAFAWVSKQGLCDESCAPYKGADGNCLGNGRMCTICFNNGRQRSSSAARGRCLWSSPR